jgi:hypothetical protein
VIQSVPSLESFGRMTTHQGSVGSLFWTWLAAVSFAQALYNRGLPWKVRGFALSVTALVFFHGLYQARDWASGWLPPLIAVGVIALLRFPRTTAAAVVVGGPAVLLLGRALVGDIETDEQYSMSTRWGALLTLWNLVKRSPILGTGLANYYYFAENLPIMGWYVRFISHNNYQDLLVQTGLLGLLAFCWFAFEAIWLTLYVYRKAPAGFPKAYAVAVLGGIAGSLASGMLGDWVIPFYYNAGILGFRSSLLFWVFAGGILTIKRQIESEAWVGAERLRATPAAPRRLGVQPAASSIAS